LRRTIRIVLLLSLWHAPVPWVHAHDLTGRAVDEVRSLHRHVDEYHARELELGERHLDLHAHLILPWSHEHQPFHRPGCPERPDTDDSDFVLELASASAGSTLKAIGRPVDRHFDPLRSTSDVISRGQLAWAAARWSSPGYGRHFFETFGCSVSIGDLICVRVC
jgi:hypothetical protein